MPDTDPYFTPDPSPSRRSSQNYDPIIEKHAARTGLDPNLIRAVMGQESSGNKTAVSPKGARGLMQLMPETAQRFGVRDINDPEQNIRGGSDYLKFLHDRYGGDINKTLAAYNSGEGNVDKYGGIPPFKETQNYVPAVKARYQRLTSQPFQQALQDKYFTQQPAPADPYFTPDTSSPQGRGVASVATTPQPQVATRQPQELNLTANDPAWHFGMTPDEWNGLSRAQKRKALPILTKAVTEDQRKKSLGQEIQQPSIQYQNEMRAKARLPLKSLAEKYYNGTDEENKPLGGNPLMPLVNRPEAFAEDELRKQAEIESANKTRLGIGLAAPPGFELLPKSAQEWLGSALAQGTGDLTNLTAGVVRSLPSDPFDSGTKTAADKINRVGNEISSGAQIMDRQAARGKLSQTAKDVLGGTIGSSPVYALMALGVPPPVAFGVHTYLMQRGQDADLLDTLTETTKAATIGALFELPVPAKAGILGEIGRRLSKAGIVGGGTELLNAVQGKGSHADALVNALFAASGGAERPETESLTQVPDIQSKLAERESSVAPTVAPSELTKRTALRGGSNETQTQPNITSQSESAQSSQIGVEPNLSNAKNRPPISSRGATESIAPSVDNSLRVDESPRHVDLQPRVKRGDGKGQFKEETTAQAEARRAQVNPEQAEPQPIETKPSELVGETAPELEPKLTKAETVDPYFTLEGNTNEKTAKIPERVESATRSGKEATVQGGTETKAPRVSSDSGANSGTRGDGDVQSSATSARKEQFRNDRADLDLPELQPAERKSWRTSLDNAKPEKAGLLTDEVLTKPRALNDEETASLVVRAQEIKNEHAQAMEEIGASSDPDTIQSKKAQADALEREFDRITRATKASGTEKGRTLAAQKLTINQDYDLVSLIQRAKAAKGRELTSDERVRYEQMARQIEDLNKQLIDANEKAQTAQLQRQIGKIQRQTRRQETKAVLDTEFAALKSQLAQAKLETRSGVQGSLLAGLDPEGKLTPIIAKMAKNRVKSGINSAEALVDEVFRAVKDHYDVSRDDIAKIVRGTLHQPDDVLSKWDKRRQSQLLKQQSDVEARLAGRDFRPKARRETPIYNRETFRLQKQVNELKAKYDREMYRATRGTTGKLIDTAAGFGNIPKTMLSMADVSAVLRQGGIGVYQHPILSGRAAVDMLKAFTSHGFANVENAIKSSPRFDQAKRSGVEFTGVDKDSPQLSKHEEGYLGSGAIDTLATGTLNPLRIVKGVKDFSERTFVSFLDSQRMRIFENQAKALEDMGLKGKELDEALKSQARYINIITGRGSLGVKGNQAAPALNVALFSPRLIASRVQFLNKMFNPVSWANTPKGARKLQMIDNAKFLFGVASTLALAKAAGANVNLDPNDSEFLKIKAGNTRYDVLAGLQQPMRFMYRMSRAIKGGETYEGEDKGKIAADFARSKAAPLAGYAVDYLEGRNRLSGKKFEAGKDLISNVIPLPFQDFRDAIKEDGTVKGIAEAFPTLFGVGVQTYPSPLEKATTKAEKLTRRLIADKMPDEGRTQEEVDKDQKLSDLRSQSRQGIDVSKTLEALKAEGQLSDKSAKSILSARGQTRLQEGFKRLGLKEALTVYSTMTPSEQDSVKKILGEKAITVDVLPLEDQKDVRKRLENYGFKAGLQIPKRPTVQRPERPNPRAWSYQQ